MAQVTRGCAPAFFLILFVVLAVAGFFGWRWYKSYLPPSASGGELQAHVLDVGPMDGDSILIVGPEDPKTKKRKTALIDAGDTGKGKVVLDALKRYGVEKLDYFIATHAHPDHLGGADEVLKATSISTVVDSGIPPPTAASDDAATTKGKGKAAPVKKPAGELPTVKSYQEFLEVVKQNGAQYEKAEPGKTYDLGGGAQLTILAPIEPHFTREQMKGGGNEPNANSVVVRLDYGDFSMLLPGDAETQTEDRMLNKDVNMGAKILKVAHHGSKYATSENFIKRVKPEVAIISTGEWNRYGHPAQSVLDRLKAAGVKVYRTDLQGEITITTKGKGYEVKTGKEATGDLWAGREAQKDDSASRGFIAYGDFGPPPKPPKEKATAKGKK
ncbi:MAG: ComEC/Rec2 family competence protein [Pyrinomonadaceae bacterium]